MARIRTLKPEFWTHNVMARLPDFEQLLAIALLNYADDEGYFFADPSLIRGAVMPFRDDLANISRGLASLSQAGFLEVKTHPERGAVGKIVAWAKHQKVDHASNSKIKELFELAKDSRDSRETLAPEQGTGNRESHAHACARADGSRCDPSDGVQPDGLTKESAKGQARSTALFDIFWVMYPKKVGKGAAMAAWNRKRCDTMADAIMSALQRQMRSEQWQREGGRFVPNPATWLNQRRWEDEAGEGVAKLKPGQKVTADGWVYS